jgi:hypothetical protein
MTDSPRLLTRFQAARYCGLSPSGFGKWVAAGRLPRAIPGTRRWDRHAVDAALDRIMAQQVEQAHKENRIPLLRQDEGLEVSEPDADDMDFERWLHSERSEGDVNGHAVPPGPVPDPMAAPLHPLSPFSLMRALRRKA